MIVVEKNSTESSHFDPIAFPEPHPEPHYVAKSKRKRRNEQRATMIKNKMMNKKTETENFLSDQFLDNAIIPEPEPMPQGGSSNKNINELRMIEINGSWVTVSPCNQPPPEFSSCSKEVNFDSKTLILRPTLLVFNLLSNSCEAKHYTQVITFFFVFQYFF